MFPVVFFRSSDSSLVNLSSTVAFPAVSAQFHPYNVSAGSCVHTDYCQFWLVNNYDHSRSR